MPLIIVPEIEPEEPIAILQDFEVRLSELRQTSPLLIDLWEETVWIDRWISNYEHFDQFSEEDLHILSRKIRYLYSNWGINEKRIFCMAKLWACHKMISEMTGTRV